ncbi:unnamed protein product [Pieris macdunnoughi]|uniref:Transcription termination factor 5, mitochondrial n=1 Tax=Pieris macdunnoughi TaxID=345717 RepID=A0A821U4N1_9NEOP|nr:unnamed protein product [Pieris macdunnoughi]
MLLGRLKLCCRLQKFMRMISINHENLYTLCRHLGISKDKAHFIMLKQPYITKFCEEDIQSMVKTVYDLGYPKDILIDYPNLFYMLPVTLKNRYKILEECGFKEITPQLLLSYLNIMKQKTVGELRSGGLIPQFFNMENRLASCMTQWPTSLTTLIYGDVNSLTLHSLRLKIIQRYLELVIDLTEDEFLRGLKTYPTLQHRPLKAINETLVILQSQVAMPKYKIKSNLYLIHADPDNLTQILFKLRELGGIDVKDVIRMYPKLATKNYSTLQEIKDILEKHGIGSEAQSRCFQVFTLSPRTVEERLTHAKTTPEFSLYINHPRFLKIILYNKTVLKRIINLKNQNKKCLSLNVLSGSSVRYESFEKAPGDRLGKGKDLVFAISQVLGSGFPTKNIRNTLRKHPFWINIPLVEVRYVCDKLTKDFSPQDIYDNVAVLLYPWNKIRKTIEDIHKVEALNGHVDINKLNKTQQLSLVVYMIEKEHYFSGNGVWTDDQQKNIVNLESKPTTKLKKI